MCAHTQTQTANATAAAEARSRAADAEKVVLSSVLAGQLCFYMERCYVSVVKLLMCILVVHRFTCHQLRATADVAALQAQLRTSQTEKVPLPEQWFKLGKHARSHARKNE